MVTIHYFNRLLGFFFIGASLIGCTGKPMDIAARHNDNGAKLLGINSYENLNFTDYVDTVSKAIRDNDGLGRNAEELAKISPFEHKSVDFDTCNNSEKVGILLIHGLTDTPYLMKDLSIAFTQKQSCTMTRSIVLPGHATTPGNLLNVTYQDWIAATTFGVKSFDDSNIADIFIAGFSTGGALALDFAIHEGELGRVRGLLLFSPAIRIKPIGGFLANWHKVVSWADPARAWFDILADDDYAKYESFPKNAADQIYLLSTQRIALSGNSLPTPIFAVISEDDETIDSADTVDFFNNRAPEESNLLVYKRKQAQSFCSLEQRICERRSIYPEFNISSFSHTAIPISKTNEHYGYDGDYASCTHYLRNEDDIKKYNDCIGTEFQWGEKNLEGKAVRRLTFNPDFENMTTLAVEFMQKHRGFK